MAGDVEYLVRWAGDHKPTWESKETLAVDYPTLLDEFHQVSNAKHWWVVVHMQLYTGNPTGSRFEDTKLQSTLMECPCWVAWKHGSPGHVEASGETVTNGKATTVSSREAGVVLSNAKRTYYVS